MLEGEDITFAPPSKWLCFTSLAPTYSGKTLLEHQCIVQKSVIALKLLSPAITDESRVVVFRTCTKKAIDLVADSRTLKACDRLE